MNETELQSSEKSGERGRAKNAMSIGDKACSGERLEGKESRRRVQGSGHIERKGCGCRRDRQVPQISFSGLATS